MLNTTIERLMFDLIDCHVKLIPWQYDHERFSVKELNLLIQRHHVVLGIFNQNKHTQAIWANKEIESLLLGRMLITSSKDIKDSPLNKATLFADTVDEIKEKLLSLSEKNSIDSVVIHDARKKYLESYNQQLERLMQRIINWKDKK